jgi:acyl-CoA synthetase (AMP-forming)/AMP-acid ligase II
MTSDDRILVPGPLVSSLFCFAALHGLAVGAEVMATGRWSPGVVQDLLPGADVVHAVPHMLERMLSGIEQSTAERGPGHRVRTALVSGAALLPGLRERAAALGIELIAYYGAVELSFVAVDAAQIDLSSLERPQPAAVHVDGNDTVGEVWVRSPWIAHRYVGDAAGPFRRDDAGWASVGDLAELGHDTLKLRGRGDGAITTGGSTVVPEDVEAVLAAVPGVSGVSSVALSPPTKTLMWRRMDGRESHMRSRMPGQTGCVMLKTPERLVSTTSRHCSGVMRWNMASRVMPALLTRMSTGPSSASTLPMPSTQES